MNRSENGEDTRALHDSLRKRPFDLYYPKVQEEVDFYVADDRLKDAANVAIATGRPLLLTGEPGTGKTTAATWIAGRLGLDRIDFQVKSTSRAQDLLYEFNAIDYFRAAQVAASAGAAAPDKGAFVVEGPLWKALQAEERPVVLLIDEVDKAPRDFPNDLLFEIDRMQIRCAERDLVIGAHPGMRPIVVITSNSERRLPEPFLRRCVYHHITLDQKTFRRILDRRLEKTERYFTAPAPFRQAAETCFFKLRDEYRLQKKPSIGEFWHWFTLAAASEAERQAVIAFAEQRAAIGTLPHLSALLKTIDDVDETQRR